MKIYMDKTIVAPWVSIIICNKCGKSVHHTEEWNPEFENFQNFEIHFGYGSEFDGTRQIFDLCDTCMAEFIQSFKIAPSLFEDIGF